MLTHGLLAWILTNILLQTKLSFLRHLIFVIIICGLNLVFGFWPIELEVTLLPIFYISTLWLLTSHLRAFFLMYKLIVIIIAALLVTVVWQIDFIFIHHFTLRTSEHPSHVFWLVIWEIVILFGARRLNFSSYLKYFQSYPWRRISAILLLLFYSLWTFTIYYHLLGSSLLLPVEMFLIISLILIFVGLISSIHVRQLQHEHNKLMIIQQNQHHLFTEIQQQNIELRRFRHDYLNTLSALQTSIEFNDITEITQIYHSVIQPIQHKLHQLPLNDISNIYSPELRNLLILKQHVAIEKQLTLKINSPTKFTLPVNLTAEIYQILAIWLDNAIESSPEKRPITIQFVSLNEQQISITNETRTLPNFKQWQNAGFTTKPHHDGLGLSTVAQIVANNPLLNMCTEINHHEVTQILSWRNGL